MRTNWNVRTHDIERCLRAAAALLALGALGACSDSTGVRDGANQLAFTVASATDAGGETATLPVTSQGDTLDLTKVSVTVERARLKREHTDACAADDHDDGSRHGDDDCARVRVGPTTVDLPLSGDVVTVPADALPAGTYRELELKLAFVRLEGTFDDQAFDLTLRLDVETEIEFDTPLVVTEGTATSITVNLAVADWFVNDDGSLIDPSTVASNPSLLAQVRRRVAASLGACEDRDHDGHDDRRGRDDHGNRGPGH